MAVGGKPAPRDIAAGEHRLIGVGELAVSGDASLTLGTQPLGAGLGVAAYDAEARVGGIWHALLPDSTVDAARAAAQPGMFVDTGILALLHALRGIGARPLRLQFHLAGAAQIMDATGCFDPGRHNFEALVVALGRRGLQIRAMETGGFANRTLHLHVGSGCVLVKTIGRLKETVL
ncbi:MAG: chemotaxis protein CheD [Verrucomicrobiota bacterium]